MKTITSFSLFLLLSFRATNFKGKSFLSSTFGTSNVKCESFFSSLIFASGNTCLESTKKLKLGKQLHDMATWNKNVWAIFFPMFSFDSHKKTFGFLSVFKGIKREHWEEKSQEQTQPRMSVKNKNIWRPSKLLDLIKTGSESQ